MQKDSANTNKLPAKYRTVYIPGELNAWLESHAAEHDLPPNRVIVRLLHLHRRAESKPAKP